MYVATVPNRSSPPAILLREAFRVNGKVKNRTLANLSRWPTEKIEALRRVLKGETTLGPPLPQAFTIARSLPHGQVAAVLTTIERLRLPRLLERKRCRQRDLVLAMIASRLLEPTSKVATARALDRATCHSSLGQRLQLDSVSENDLYAALDWLGPRQAAIETALAKRHLSKSTLVLYDVTSTYFEGRKCPLAQSCYSRDERRGNPQIVVGLVSNQDGCPVAVEVFEGNTADPNTLATQLDKLRQRFGFQQLVLVGDRGLLTHKRSDDELRPLEGVEWITALRAPRIRTLAADEVLQMSLFDERDLAEVSHPNFPGERLVVCRNPLLAEERARQREELIAAAEKKIETLRAVTRRQKRRWRDRDQINYRLGRLLANSKVAKYFRWDITAEGLEYERNQQAIERDEVLDGVYVIRTSLSDEKLKATEAVRAYKRLAQVQRAFRSLQSVDLHLRPIYHRLPDRVRAHLLLCLLAYHVEWHMRQALAPLLFDDEQRGQESSSPLAPAEGWAAARAKARRKRTPEGLPVQSFQDWLKDLATITKNRLEASDKRIPSFEMTTRPTPPQGRALELLKVKI